ncbi:MAG: SDR family NAD(P)-dependent oxidoreductase, partial [Planctomycetales bacterium]|nr:SDR family NAD(P)-dependent oxidoreductase [Planctomycetales bacterium]
SKAIIITGSSRGLGAAAARIVAHSNAQVALAARSGKKLRELADEIQRNGGTALPIEADLTDEKSCAEVVQRTVAAFGQIDSLVNNAGVIEPIAPLSKADLRTWDLNIRINLLAPVRLTAMALPHLRRARGRVINISSGAAIHATPGWGAYCSSKAALNHFTRVLSVEEPEITAIAFRPGVVDTAMQAKIRLDGRAGMPAEAHARFLGYNARGELLPPERPGRALAALALHADES